MIWSVVWTEVLYRLDITLWVGYQGTSLCCARCDDRVGGCVDLDSDDENDECDDVVNAMIERDPTRAFI